MSDSAHPGASSIAEAHGTYGQRRVHAVLTRSQIAAGLELVRALMGVELDLVPCQPRPRRPVTTVPGDATELPDLECRDFTAVSVGDQARRRYHVHQDVPHRAA